MAHFGRPASTPAPDPEWEVSAEDVRRRLDAGEDLLLVDCRTDLERELARIEPSMHAPMDALDRHVETITERPGRPVVVYCHHGVRSLRVAAALRRLGLDSVRSLAGGIDRWSTAVDPSVPRY